MSISLRVAPASDWTQMRVPPEMLTGHLGGLVTAVTEPTDGRLVMMLDVERVLSETTHYDDEAVFQDEPMTRKGITVFFADDSAVARKQIQRTLDLMHVAHVCALDGRQAWEKLQEIAAHAEATGRPVKDLIQAVLTDVEMPEMDDEAHQFACRRYRIIGYRAQAVEERLRLLADQIQCALSLLRYRDPTTQRTTSTRPDSLQLKRA